MAPPPPPRLHDRQRAQGAGLARTRLGGCPHSSPAASLPEIVAPYFDEVAGAARSGLFDAIGHLDIVKRWLVPHVLPEQFAQAPEIYEPVLAALVASGTALEVNASGLRQLPRETYPTAAVVARYRELGGRHVTIGSDAHRMGWFAYGLAEAYRLAASTGFEELAFRRGGDRVIGAPPSGTRSGVSVRSRSRDARESQRHCANGGGLVRSKPDHRARTGAVGRPRAGHRRLRRRVELGGTGGDRGLGWRRRDTGAGGIIRRGPVD